MRYIWLVELIKRVRCEEGEIYASHPFLVKDVLFSAILMRANEALLDIAEVVGASDEERSTTRGWIERGLRGLEERWDPELELCLDYGSAGRQAAVSMHRRRLRTAHSGHRKPRSPRSLLEVLDSTAFLGDPELRWPLPPSTSPQDPEFHPRRYWRGPVWPVFNWLLWSALVRAGEPERAERLRQASLEQAAVGGFGEYFEPFTGELLGSDNQSWTAAVVLDWLSSGPRPETGETAYSTRPRTSERIPTTPDRPRSHNRLRSWPNSLVGTNLGCQARVLCFTMGLRLVVRVRGRYGVKTDILVVGAGYAGSVVAERLASAGKRVYVIDRRPHVGGNAYDEYDEHGVLIHRYGPHIFHTNSGRIVDYLSNFTEWRPYEHRALAHVDGKLLPIPINLDTVNKLYGLNLGEEDVKAFFERVREPRTPLLTSEDVVVGTVGRDLYETFFKNYTRKHWGLESSQLNAGVTARVPVRTNRDDRYWTDDFQGVPLHGYTRMFEAMLDHPKISVELGVDFHEVKERVRAEHTVYTGPVDAYFGYRFGKLPYRSLYFEHEHLPNTSRYQHIATINYPNDHDYIRVTEFKHVTGQEHPGTSIVREYPQSEGDPYYPIPRPENESLYKRYQSLGARERNVTFVGRLAQYRYYNMDQVAGAALRAAQNILGRATKTRV